MSSRDDRLETLLADALAAHDQGGQQALDAFLAANAADATALARGLERCRQMGLLGAGPGVARRDFPERLGEFRLIRRLGSGGMGVVYEAEQESLGRRVALKVVRPELLYFEGARERFRREIEAVARLQHPAVVPVLASGDQDGVPWYAMELLAGRTVYELCEALEGRDPASLRGADLRQALGASAETGTDPLDGAWWQICTRIAHTVALGVRHAHLRGIVHRDIKPSNVMLTPDGRVVLLDFGVALLGGGARELTRPGRTPGSPAFMSPEQLRGDAVDERTDVYSLGATLWQMLTLVAPFRGDVDLQRIRDGDVPTMLAHNRELPRELVLVVQKAMDRDRERRYADVEAFAEDLTAVLQRRPIRARGLSLPLRGWRWCQRHRVMATALASLLLVAMCLPVVFAWRERATNAELAAAVQLAEQSNTALAAAVKSAEGSLDTALDAISSLLVKVGTDELRHVPEAERVALAALHDACAMYRSLLRDHPDHERMRVDAGKARSRYGELLVSTGATKEGIEVLREGIADLGGSSLVSPRCMHSRMFLSVNLASALEQHGDDAGARAVLDALAPALVFLETQPGMTAEVARVRVRVLSSRAGLAPRASPETEALHREVVAAARRLPRLATNAFDQRALVEALDNLATELVAQKRHDEALSLLDEALPLARALPADAKLWPPAPMMIAQVLETIGTLHVNERDERAIPALKECLELREEVVRKHPHDVRVRSMLGGALHNLANLNFLQAQDDLALERIDRAIALQRTVVADMPGFVSGRANLRRHLVLRGSVLVKVGDRAGVAAVAEELAADRADPGGPRSGARFWLRAAELLAREQPPPAGAAELRAGYLDRAMAALLAADSIGWGANSRLGEALYAPLRERAEFRALEERVANRTRKDQPGGAEPSTSSASREMPR